MKGIFGQSAIEYLMTYGWMLLVVAVVGGAIFSITGDQSIESVQGFESNNINVQDFGVSQENGLMFSIHDPIGQTDVREIRITDTDSNITYELNQKVSDQNTINLLGVTHSEESEEIEVEIIYNAGNLENLSTSGIITGDLELNENFHRRTMILDGLAGYWAMDERYTEGNMIYDLSSNNNRGKIDEDVERNIPSPIGESFEFQGEGGGAVDTNADISIHEWDGHTVSTWLNVNSFQHNEQNVAFSQDYMRFFLQARDANTFRCRTRLEGDESLSVTSSEHGENEWLHVLCTSYLEDGTAHFEIYVNGEKESSSSINEVHSYYDLQGDFVIGSRADDVGEPQEIRTFDGKINEVIVYNRALSEDEVQVVYDSGDFQ